MTTQTSSFFQSILGLRPVSRVRRNHGLEHATLHVLGERFPKLSMAGHSDVNGFWLLGEVPTEEVRSAVFEALQRMNAGEHSLAVHPNCGTNYVTAGTVAGVAASVAMFGAGRRFRDKLERVPLAASLATLALMFSQPLGLLFQEKVTTSGHPGALEVIDIQPSHRGRFQAHRILTRG